MSERQPGGVLLTLAAFFIVVAGLQAGVSLVNPFLLALFVSILCAPALFALQERGVPGPLALCVVMAGVALLFVGIGAVVGSSVTEFTARMPSYELRLREMTDAAALRAEAWGLPADVSQLRGRFDTGAAFQLAGTLVAGLGSFLTNTLLILLTAVFMLLEAASFRGKMAAAVADPDASLARFEAIRQSVKRYVAIKTGTSALTGVTVGLWLWALGVDFPLLWGLLAFLFNYVPNIGSFVAAVPAILLAVVQLGWGEALLAALGYLAINTVVGSALEPRLMGRGTGLSPLVVFVSLIFWGWVLGPVGMLLSVPLTMTAKVALESSDGTRWIAILLGPAVVAPQSAAKRA